jgi:hypothetical protein
MPDLSYLLPALKVTIWPASDAVKAGEKHGFTPPLETHTDFYFYKKGANTRKIPTL